MLSRELVLFLSRENYSPCATALKEKKRGKKKWVKGLDNSGNIEGPRHCPEPDGNQDRDRAVAGRVAPRDQPWPGLGAAVGSSSPGGSGHRGNAWWGPADGG